ncbi:MAG: hypothetical protein JSV86_05465 [Gemmatimonadota bacterium]|nr:MAG: hypothetical protein JSV86_05465 [Gemmatimonadota bacterium]
MKAAIRKKRQRLVERRNAIPHEVVLEFLPYLTDEFPRGAGGVQAMRLALLYWGDRRVEFHPSLHAALERAYELIDDDLIEEAAIYSARRDARGRRGFFPSRVLWVWNDQEGEVE